MALVRAKEPCYLGEAGYKTPDDGEFEYNGPKHDSLEAVKKTADPAVAGAPKPQGN